MDGNGRWAAGRGLPRLAGHRAGAQNVRPILAACGDLGVSFVTLYGLSTESWGRPRAEVEGLMSLLVEFLDRGLADLHAEGVRVRHVGSPAGLPGTVQGKLQQAIEATAMNGRLTVALAFNYGGRADIVDSVRALIAEGVSSSEIDESHIAAHLSTAGMPDPDLIIRTGGDLRLSNFLVWEAAYTEYWATSVPWPDFNPSDLASAIQEYARRQRRFGGLVATPGTR
jgi:undecaprenyl diphosphate synthase